MFVSKVRLCITKKKELHCKKEWLFHVRCLPSLDYFTLSHGKNCCLLNFLQDIIYLKYKHVKRLISTLRCFGLSCHVMQLPHWLFCVNKICQTSYCTTTTSVVGFIGVDKICQIVYRTTLWLHYRVPYFSLVSPRVVPTSIKLCLNRQMIILS